VALYKIIEALAGMGIPQAIAAYNLLKERFANQGGGQVRPEHKVSVVLWV
jgi:hypothetical protein